MAKLVECVPNFSVSRETDPAVFQGLVDTANSIPGCFVFDVQSDGSHNRCVFTLLGSPEAMTEAAFQLTKKATETIDMRRHTGMCGTVQARCRAHLGRTSRAVVPV